MRNLLLTIFCLLLAGGTGNCVEVPEQAFMSHLRAAYRAAVDDAAKAEQSEISDHLVPVLPGQRGTRWKEINGKKYVLTVTRRTSWHDYADNVDAFIDLKQDVWITLAPQVRDFCSELEINDHNLDLRLEQLLGLPPRDKRSVFVEMWVKPDDLFRPCPDPEIHDTRCELHFPKGTDREHKKWFERRRAASYGEGESAYPWTRLGYTYDWGSSSGKIGLSEYVIGKGATVRVGLLGATSTYCAGGSRGRGTVSFEVLTLLLAIALLNGALIYWMTVKVDATHCRLSAEIRELREIVKQLVEKVDKSG